MSGRRIDAIVREATMLAIDRLVAQKRASVPRPANHDLASLAQYWAGAVAAVGEDLALRVAADIPIGSFGIASYGMVSAANLAAALDALSNTYLGRMIAGMKLRVLPASRAKVDVRLDSDDDSSGLMPLIEEIVIAVLHRHLALLAQPATVLGVTLRRARPAHTAPWTAYFGIPPRFSQLHSGLRLDAASLGSGLRTASSELHGLVSAASDAETGAKTASARVRSYVRTHMLAAFDTAAVARALSMTARTLQRNLQAENTSLREIATAVRIEVARELLEHTDRTVANISESLGYAKPASLTRAFVAATGETPGDYRKRTKR